VTLVERRPLVIDLLHQITDLDEWAGIESWIRSGGCFRIPALPIGSIPCMLILGPAGDTQALATRSRSRTGPCADRRLVDPGDRVSLLAGEK